MNRAGFLAVVLVLVAAVLPSQAVAADPWPSRPIRLVVPSAPGTGSDLLARALAERLGVALQQPVIIDNKPGGSGLIATRALMSAPADGYTLLYSNASTTVILAAMKPDLGIDFTKDITPVALTVVGGVFLLVNPDFPAKNLKELIAVVKANPAKYS
jgi:tripartite-type tricarboxylate transporter receptor subunit TctC